MVKKVSYIIGILVLSFFLLGWSPFLHRLHKDKGGGVWEKHGIVNDYKEWKITPKEFKIIEKIEIVELTVVWRANFRNTTDKTKRIWITFQLLDKDNFVIGSERKGYKGIYSSNAIYLSPKENKVIEGKLRIDKKMAPSAHKSRLLLGAEDIE